MVYAAVAVVVIAVAVGLIYTARQNNAIKQRIFTRGTVFASNICPISQSM